jgi:uncharacterized protein (DUF433 family)
VLFVADASSCPDGLLDMLQQAFQAEGADMMLPDSGSRRPGGISDNESRTAMASLSDFEKMLPALSRGEKAQILKWVVRELDDDFPGIDSRPDVCGGEPCIVRTRIPVWLLEQARRLGTSEQALLAAYPQLRAEDLVNAWAYARSHAEEIETQIHENETA